MLYYTYKMCPLYFPAVVFEISGIVYSLYSYQTITYRPIAYLDFSIIMIFINSKAKIKTRFKKKLCLG